MCVGKVARVVVEWSMCVSASQVRGEAAGVVSHTAQMLCGEIGFYSGLPLALTVFRL